MTCVTTICCFYSWPLLLFILRGHKTILGTRIIFPPANPRCELTACYLGVTAFLKGQCQTVVMWFLKGGGGCPGPQGPARPSFPRCDHGLNWTQMGESSCLIKLRDSQNVSNATHLSKAFDVVVSGNS